MPPLDRLTASALAKCGVDATPAATQLCHFHPSTHTPTTTPQNGATVLHWAQFGPLRLIKKLIAKGADINAKDAEVLSLPLRPLPTAGPHDCKADMPPPPIAPSSPQAPTHMRTPKLLLAHTPPPPRLERAKIADCQVPRHTRGNPLTPSLPHPPWSFLRLASTIVRTLERPYTAMLLHEPLPDCVLAADCRRWRAGVYSVARSSFVQPFECAQAHLGQGR